jgi:hypothetical protein
MKICVVMCPLKCTEFAVIIDKRKRIYDCYCQPLLSSPLIAPLPTHHHYRHCMALILGHFIHLTYTVNSNCNEYKCGERSSRHDPGILPLTKLHLDEGCKN